MFQLIDFKRYSSIQIGGKYKVKIIDEIADYSEYTIIGKCNNILISNNPPKMAMLSDKFDYIKMENNKLIVGGATNSGKLLTFCKKNNIKDFEFLAKLPGNIGGLTKMNAGLKEWEIFNIIHSIKTNSGIITKNKIKYSYRKTDINGIIYETIFNINYGYSKEKQLSFLKMRDNQPKIASAGSCFKNTEKYSAGYLLENVGLKGFNIGNMGFSAIHSNFLINLGGGTFDDAIKLIDLAKQKVKDKFNISLELEIIIM